MKCLIALCLVMFGSCLAEQVQPLPNSYGYIPRNSNQDALLSYVAVNNPVLLRQDPILYQEQVPQLEVVSHRGSFSHYVHPRNYQSFQASLQSSAIPSNAITLTRGSAAGTIVGQPLLASVQRTESRIDIPSGLQGPQGIQQNSQLTSQLSQQLGPQGGRLTGLGGPSAPRQTLNLSNLNVQRGSQGSQIQRGPGPNQNEPLQRRQ